MTGVNVQLAVRTETMPEGAQWQDGDSFEATPILQNHDLIDNGLIGDLERYLYDNLSHKRHAIIH